MPSIDRSLEIPWPGRRSWRRQPGPKNAPGPLTVPETVVILYLTYSYS